jgi:hypothetical protein
MPSSTVPKNQPRSSETSVTPERLAQLIAIGSEGFPPELPADELSHLEGLVRRYRCERLLKLIAVVIAADIANDRQHAEGEKSQ